MIEQPVTGQSLRVQCQLGPTRILQQLMAVTPPHAHSRLPAYPEATLC